MSLVERELDGAIATLWLNRPEARNALSIDMCDAIAAALESFTHEDRARVLVIRGRGDVFCSGADFAAISGPAGVDFLPSFDRMLEALARHRLPTIAAIDGAALGGGLQLAVACDFRVAGHDARIGIPSSTLGILVDFENVQRLVLLAGIEVAKEVLMTGRIYRGPEAVAARLVSRCVPDADLAAEAGGLAADIASRAPLSVQGSKRSIQAVIDHLSSARSSHPDAVDAVDRLVENAYKSRDLQEGLRAMKEKRPPEFEGI